MTSKKRSSLSKRIINYVMIIPTLFTLISHIVRHVEQEAKLAGKSLVRICVLSLFFLTFLITTWLCVLAILFLWLVALNLSWIFSLIILLLLNMLLLLGIVVSILNAKSRLFFPITRELINEAFHLGD